MDRIESLLKWVRCKYRCNFWGEKIPGFYDPQVEGLCIDACMDLY